MISADPRPLLFLDVDGPLLPFGGTGHPLFDPPLPAGGHALLARIDPAHGPRLAALPCDLVWATTWAGDANDVICPRIGLAPLPVVEWPAGDDLPGGLHWKTRTLVAWAAGRPFAWVDDEISDTDHAWVAAHHPGPALLHRVDPRHGLTLGDYAALTAWLTNPRQAVPRFA